MCARIDAGDDHRSTASACEIRDPRDAIAAGLGLLTEDRKQTGIMGVLSVRDNMSIASLGGSARAACSEAARSDATARRSARRSRSRRRPSHQLIKLLSGGNQQKVLVSRWLITTPTS